MCMRAQVMGVCASVYFSYPSVYMYTLKNGIQNVGRNSQNSIAMKKQIEL